MKTYTTTQKLGLVSVYLIAVKCPFHFDGECIEFTAPEKFMLIMCGAAHPLLAGIEFKVKDIK